MAKHAVIRVSDGKVVNVVEWDDFNDDWTPPVGTVAIPSDDVAIGDSWDGKLFSRPVVEDVPPVESDVQKLATVLKRKGIITDQDFPNALAVIVTEVQPAKKPR